MNTNETQNVKMLNSDPSAIGLFGLAMVTLVASSQKLDITTGTSFIIPWAIFLDGFAFLGYLIFTLFMTIGAAEANKVLFIIFILIDFLFLGLTLTTFKVMTEATHSLAAYSEFLISMVSFYGCAATVLNPHLGRVFLPVGKPLGIFKKAK
jgi:succinate-acetate transporter protein